MFVRELLEDNCPCSSSYYHYDYPETAFGKRKVKITRMIQSINKVNEELGGYNDGSCSLQAPPIYVDVCIPQKIARDPADFLCFIDKDLGRPKKESIDDSCKSENTKNTKKQTEKPVKPTFRKSEQKP